MGGQESLNWWWHGTMVEESRRRRWMHWGRDRWDCVTQSRLRRRDRWVTKCWGSQELLLPDSFHQSLEWLKLFLVLLQLHLHPCLIMLEEENILVSILLHLCHVLLQTGYLVLQHVSISHARCLHTRWGGRRVGHGGCKGECKTDILGFECWHPRWVINIYFNNCLVMSRQNESHSQYLLFQDHPSSAPAFTLEGPGVRLVLNNLLHFTGLGVTGGTTSDGTLDGNQGQQELLQDSLNWTCDLPWSLSVSVHFIFLLQQFKHAIPFFTKQILPALQHLSQLFSGQTGSNPTSARNDVVVEVGTTSGISCWSECSGASVEAIFSECSSATWQKSWRSKKIWLSEKVWYQKHKPNVLSVLKSSLV